jgi:hypothetical protein
VSDLDVPDGMALTCRTCDWRPGIDLPMGLVAAHFETEHDTDDIQLELVVLCAKCDRSMAYERSQSGRDIFACGPCHRTRAIRRKA